MSRLLLPALAACLLAGLVLFSAAAPARGQEPFPRIDAGLTHLLRGSLLDLPARGTLVLSGTHLGASLPEAAAVRAFLERGGNVLVADATPEAASLVRHLDVGVEAGPAAVFDPDVDAQGRFPAAGSGALGVSGRVWLSASRVVSGAGTPLAVTSPFAWRDQGADGRPDLGDARGAWAVGRVVEVGAGRLVVLGTRDLLATEPAATPLQAWLAEESPLLLDASHQGVGDPLEARSLLSGQQAVPVAVLLAILAAAAGALVWRMDLRRTRPPRARPAPDLETLELLAELPIAHGKGGPVPSRGAGRP